VVRLFGAGAAAGIGESVIGETVVLPEMDITMGPGRIVAFIGPSGSGKSTALNLIRGQFPAAHDVQRVQFPTNRAIVDAVAPKCAFSDALNILSLCALGEAPLWLRRYSELSTGEQFRARLARAVGAGFEHGRGGVLIIDEFTSGLHGRAARAIAYNLRRLATRMGLSVVVATTRSDLLSDLRPDTVVTLEGQGRGTVSRPTARKGSISRGLTSRGSISRGLTGSGPISLWRRLRIEPGAKRDYDAFAGMHYRQGDELGFVDRVLLLREGKGGPAVAIIVFCHAPAELVLRNKALPGRFVKNLPRLNREMRILRRVVVHPDLRGCGVAHRFVRRALPMAGTRYVECLAAMGAVNPIFERAGMRRVGVCAIPRHREKIVQSLKGMGVDPLAAGFESQVARRPVVRRLVEEYVRRWYRGASGEGRPRAARQSPAMLARIFRGLVDSRPVYYLWENKTVPQ
jgi:ABC-type hemin transport system ATPase subunit/GNAT superfamily N-acetyltransferase